MEPPKIDGITIRSEIGSGATGTVYDAKGRNEEDCVVKVLDSMASNPVLLENRIARLQNRGAQDVTVQIHAHALNTRPACLVMPLMAERLEMVGGVERYRPRNLQIFFALNVKVCDQALKPSYLALIRHPHLQGLKSLSEIKPQPESSNATHQSRQKALK